MNRGKSLLYVPGDSIKKNHNPLPSDIPINRTGFDLLGACIGPPSFCEASTSKRVKKII